MQLSSLAIDVFSTLELAPLSMDFDTAIGIEPDTLGREVFPHRSETGSHFLNTGNTRGMNIVETWSESCAKGFTFEYIEKFKIRSRVFDGNDVSVKGFDCPEDVVEIRLQLV
jgi:hypothetical protein